MNPRGGIRIEEFIRPEQVFEVAEAIRRVFDQHGDRANKHKARLRYVLNRVGDDAFKELYRKELAAVREQGLDGDIPRLSEIADRFGSSQDSSASPEDRHESVQETHAKLSHLLLPEKDPQRITIRLPLPLGDISSDDLVVVAGIAERYGQGFVRATQQQELLIPGVMRRDVSEALGVLETTGIFAEIATPRPRIVTCAGASTCKLGLCQSRQLAKALSEHFGRQGVQPSSRVPVIRISGCPNSCGGHHIGAIGLEGRAERHHGRLMPFYVVMAGGKLSEDGARLAEPLGSVPAKRIPDLLAKAFAHDAANVDALHNLVSAYSVLPKDPPEDLFRDFGEDKPFSLAGRGPGECGVGVFDVIQTDIHEATRAVEATDATDDTRAKTEALYRAILASARSLLVIFGLELNKDREIFAAFERELVVPGWVRADTRDLIAAALDWKIDADAESLLAFADRVRELVTRVGALFASLDANLKFRLAPISQDEPPFTPSPAEEPIARVDLRGVACPLNFVKAKVALEKIPVNGVLEVLLDDGEPIRNVPASFTEQGQEVLAIEPFEDRHLLRLRRRK